MTETTIGSLVLIGISALLADIPVLDFFGWNVWLAPLLWKAFIMWAIYIALIFAALFMKIFVDFMKGIEEGITERDRP